MQILARANEEQSGFFLARRVSEKRRLLKALRNESLKETFRNCWSIDGLSFWTWR